MVDKTDELAQRLKSQATLEKETSHYIECISLIGTKMYFSIHLLPLFFKRMELWVVLISFVVLMCLLDPTLIVPVGGYSAAFSVWFCMAALYVVFTILTLSFFYFIFRKGPVKSVLLPISSFAIVYLLILLGPFVERLFVGDLGPASQAFSYQYVLQCFLIEQVFMTLYVSLGFPLTIRKLNLVGMFPGEYFASRLKTSEIKGDAPVKLESLGPQNLPPKVILIGTQSFNVSDIQSISAEEHYVRVQTSFENTLIRDKFSQVVARVPDGIGFQSHRSHWVAFSHVHDVVKDGTHYKIQLDMGDFIPISESRRRKLQEQLLIYRNAIPKVAPTVSEASRSDNA